MFSVALSRLVLICNFFEKIYFAIFVPTCFYEKQLKFHIYFHLDDSARWKQYQTASPVMMEQICDLKIVKLQEIPINVCVIFYNTGISY